MSPSLNVSPASREHSNTQSNQLEVRRGFLLLAGPAGAGGRGGTSSLAVRMSTGQPSAALANRPVPVEPVSGRLA
jgi:hypothetical protein